MNAQRPANKPLSFVSSLNTRTACILGWFFLATVVPTFSPLRGQDLTPQNEASGFERVPFNLDRFTERSDVIVHGIVSRKEVKWTDKTLYTYYELVVQETIQGAAQSSVTVAILGGTLGNIGLAVPDTPDLKVGDEVVLFGKTLEGQQSFEPVGLGTGVIRVTPGSNGQARYVTPRGWPESLNGFLDAVRSRKR